MRGRADEDRVGYLFKIGNFPTYSAFAEGAFSMENPGTCGKVCLLIRDLLADNYPTVIFLEWGLLPPCSSPHGLYCIENWGHGFPALFRAAVIYCFSALIPEA